MNSETQFNGYVSRVAFGRYRVEVTGQGVMDFEYPIRFTAWSREAAIAKAERWCDRQVRGDERHAEWAYDPNAPSRRGRLGLDIFKPETE